MSGYCSCGTPVLLPPGVHLCPECFRALVTAVGQLRAVWRDILLTMARQGTRARQEGHTPASEAPLPLDPAAAEVYGRACSWLHRAGLTEPAHGRWAFLAGAQVASMPDAMDRFRELSIILVDAHRIVDLPPSRCYLGICSAPIDNRGNLCQTDIYGRMDRATAKCRVCGAKHYAADRRATMLASAEDQCLTGQDLARAITWMDGTTVSPERIRQWASRGKLTARGRAVTGQPLYRVGDALDILRAQLARKVPSAP